MVPSLPLPLPLPLPLALPLSLPLSRMVSSGVQLWHVFLPNNAGDGFVSSFASRIHEFRVWNENDCN